MLKLIGKHDDFLRYRETYTPSRTIFVGNLQEANSVEIDDSKSESSNSLSLRFLLNDLTDKIDVNLSLSIFYRVYPTFEEQVNFIRTNYEETDDNKKFQMANIWKRKDIDIKTISFNENGVVKVNLKPYITDILNSDELYLGTDKVAADIVENEEKFNSFIENIPTKKKDFLNWDVEVSFKTQNYSQNGENLKLCTISLVNMSRNPEDNPKLYEGNIFAPAFDINLNDNTSVPFKYNYEHDGYKRVYEEYLRCINCQGKLKDNHILTTAYSSFNQEKVLPKSQIEGVDIDFKTLSTEEGLDELNKILDLMDKHLEDCELYYENDKSSIEYPEEYLEGISNFKTMRQNFSHGIDLLSDKENENILKAFLLMNKAFELNSREKPYHSWRLFQIVFIVSELIDVVDKSSSKDTCSLLHVMTGGGKSEAYFGLVIFSAFYDRLIGKRFGVTAFTKFPLRMLSIQQLQRIANIFIWAEEIRKEENLGGEPFSIAYYVGSTDDEFPDYNYKVITIMEKNERDGQLTPGKIIDKCPVCEDHPPVYLDVDLENNTVIHKCSVCGREYRLYFSDDEIYRMIPTFIVSTVDKLAAVSSNRRFKNLFGGKLDKCPEGHGFNSRNDICFYKDINGDQCKKFGGPEEVEFNTGPSLMIQDEMHLIREGFGTIDSHFESMFETLEQEMGGSTFKRIAMTATVAGAENQIKELYDKKIVVFPPKLMNSKNEDFFFDYEKDSDGNPRIHRQIIGVKPNNSVFSPLVIILRYAAQFFKIVDENLEDFANEHDFDLVVLKEVKEYYKQILTYHKKKDETQIVKYFAKSLINGREDSYDIEARPLTGENDLDYIKETIDMVENYYENPNNKEKLLIVNATSIVSHGVDIDKWNFMIFSGMPNNTSEYIQALSRAGRQKFGIIFLTFVPHRTRDLSFYHHFNEYHNILDDKVEDVALSRWTKLGFDQTFTSIFLGAIMNYLSNELEKPIYLVKDIKEVFINNYNEIRRARERDIKEEPLEILVDFLHKAYLTHYNVTGSKYFRESIKKEAVERILFLANYGISNENSTFLVKALKHNDDKNYKTQTGMRGIQDTIILRPGDGENTFRYNWG